MSSKWWWGVALAIGCTGAQAVVRSGVWISAPSMQLYDLDPHDGITPMVSEGGPDIGFLREVLQPAPIVSETNGSAFVSESGPSIIGKTTASGSSFLGIADLYAPPFSFTLTPQSSVRIVAPYRLSTFSTERARNGEGGGYASFELSVLALNDLQYQPEYGDWNYSILSYGVVEDHIGHDENDQPIVGLAQRRGALEYTITNASSSNALFAYRGELLAWGVSPVVAPVPEPGTIGLMVTALGMVGWAARRNRRRQTKASDQIECAQLQA